MEQQQQMHEETPSSQRRPSANKTCKRRALFQITKVREIIYIHVRRDTLRRRRFPRAGHYTRTSPPAILSNRFFSIDWIRDRV